MATVITNVGKTIYNNRLKGTGTEPLHVAWGTGAGTAVISGTTLFTEAAEARTAGTSSLVTTTTTNDTYQVVGAITAAGNKTITNVGLFDASTAGNLFFHADFTGVALNTGESISFTLKTQLT